MRTLFLCPELALQIEGFDTHAYHVSELVHVRYRDRLVSLVIDSIVDTGILREINLRPVSREEMAMQPAFRIPDAPPPPNPDWLDEFCRAIEGAKGPVLWVKPGSSR